ncbi:hypothetical protein FACS1894166_08410 [Bacilli bacterium]|nr:hypothetical protein FACS1894166_08410 [Bacilli bacterium]
MPTTPPNNQSVMQNQGPQSVLDIQQDILNNYRQSIRKPPRVSHPDGSPSFIATIKNDEHRMKTADLSIKNENLYGKRPNSK